MIKFRIKVTTKEEVSFVSSIMDVPSMELFEIFYSKLHDTIGQSNFKLTDDDGDVIIFPQKVINECIIQLIKVND